MTAGTKAVEAMLRFSYYARGPVLWDWLHKSRSIVLMYHGITSRSAYSGVENYYGFNLPVSELERQLEYLKKRCNPVSLQDLLAGRGLSRSRTNVVVTFDDGYGNNYGNAFPLLSRYEIPAVFALTTGFIADSTPLWNDVIEHLVQNCSRSEVNMRWDSESRDFELRGFEGRLALYNWLMALAVRIPQERRDDLLEYVARELGSADSETQIRAREDYRPMTTDQIALMSRSGLIEFASHSVHHYLLSKLAPEKRTFELTESKRAIEQWSGAPCTTFCVPGGAYDDDVLERARGAGYTSVLTSDVGRVRPGAPTMNRNGIFNGRGIHWYADLVHGPVHTVVARARRTRARIRSRLRSGAVA